MLTINLLSLRISELLFAYFIKFWGQILFSCFTWEMCSVYQIQLLVELGSIKTGYISCGNLEKR